MKKKETKEGRGGHGPSRSSETISKGTCRTSSAQHYKRYISGSQFYKLISARRFRLLNARVQRRGSRFDSEWRKEYRLHKKGLPYYPSSPSLLVPHHQTSSPRGSSSTASPYISSRWQKHNSYYGTQELSPQESLLWRTLFEHHQVCMRREEIGREDISIYFC